ncbi:hypothetical protein BGW36DRAFT_372952 [Talaromyces proteolyticus]|uniref:DNA mismatch repair protein HSM3 N-terminal domain-containing protein n=1 Tax=Talaromyces proteolyticus TaxID=1131652 RepID=A0AAD4Q455_9EURO|nr:uncharacterized protein BGW36DRAFT_372952 [Talaromyces proteolyticus]KAH8702488.1 hypothetical protein BGW36DRAFT_372952 [Talaromyces proteolyticus]
MATTPSPYYAVKENLDAILADPSTAIDVPSIEKLKLEITRNTDTVVPASLIAQISQVLPVLQHDPTPLTSLGIKATAFLTFSDLQAIDPPVNLLAGIQAPSPPINMLALSLLEKANSSPSDAAIVAGNSELMANLVELWLSTSTTEVAQAAFDVLWSLLEVDHIGNETGEGFLQRTAGGQGLLWRRLFSDKSIYGLFFTICSLYDARQERTLSKREKSVAQGRLLEFIVKAGTLRWDAISTSHAPEIESKYGSSSLLHFAVCQMIDTSDVLMHMTLLNFLRDLIEIEAPGLDISRPAHPISPFSSRALDFLVEQKLHQKILKFYLDPSQVDPIDITFLDSPITAYVAQYSQLYPNHLLQNPREVLDSILSRIHRSFSIPSAQWAHGQVPIGDLSILASLPRVMLVEASQRSLNPLQAIPSNPPNKDCFNTLTKVFHGPLKSSATVLGEASTDMYREAVSARTLYFAYLNEHASLWKDITASADIVSMKDVALSAIALIRGIVTANWDVLSADKAHQVPDTSAFKLPSEDELSTNGPGKLPTSGPWAILTPPALTTVLPYLFKPPLSYSNFVAGGVGDVDSAVWRMATAKYDVLVDFYNALKRSSDQVDGFEDIIKTLEQRVRDGPQGPVVQVGSRVEALDL